MENITESQVMEYLKINKPAIYYLILSQTDLIKNSNVRDLGKMFAESNEYIQRDWINENTSLNVSKREEIQHDANASGYDLITNDLVLKLQSKVRFGTLHLEQTRRKSKKNKDSSNTGHVRYSVGEADVYIFSRPKSVEGYLDIKSWDFLAIPERALEDPNLPGYLLNNVPKKIWKQFVGKAKQVLESEYQRKLNK
jgi:hypothetical protein